MKDVNSIFPPEATRKLQESIGNAKEHIVQASEKIKDAVEEVAVQGVDASKDVVHNMGEISDKVMCKGQNVYAQYLLKGKKMFVAVPQLIRDNPITSLVLGIISGSILGCLVG